MEGYWLTSSCISFPLRPGLWGDSATRPESTFMTVSLLILKHLLRLLVPPHTDNMFKMNFPVYEPAQKVPMPSPECSEMCCVRQALSMTTLTSARLTQSSEGFQARLSIINPLWSMTYCYFLKMKKRTQRDGNHKNIKVEEWKSECGLPILSPSVQSLDGTASKSALWLLHFRRHFLKEGWNFWPFSVVPILFLIAGSHTIAQCDLEHML